METSEVVLGFDLRARAFPSSLETPQYRDRYLYRPDVVSPFTVDPAVWPSLLQGSENLWAWHFSRSEFQLADNPEQLRQRFSERLASEELVLLAITAIVGDDFAQPGDLPGITGNEPQPASNWEFLGFDVADRFLLSAVSNTGFSELPLEKSKLRSTWGARLNDKHLLPHREAAREFKVFADRATPEHAPFFVFGLWEVK